MEPERCDGCGFDATRLTNTDAVAALRSLGRRWRELFADQAPEDLRRTGASGHSALGHADAAQEAVGRLRLALEGAIQGGSVPEPGAAAAGDDPEMIVRRLDEEAQQMALAVEGASPDALERQAVFGDRDVDGRWILMHAVHEATHHLKDAEALLAPS